MLNLSILQHTTRKSTLVSSDSPADMNEHFVPLVAVCGTGNTESTRPKTPFKLEAIDLEPSRPLDEKAIAISRRLSSRSTQPGPWILPSESGQPLNVEFFDKLELPVKSSPSPLSPRNPDSPLYPHGILCEEWIEKYLYFVPTTVMLWVNLEESDKEIVARVERLREELRSVRSQLIVVALRPQGMDEAGPRLSALLRATGLTPRTGLVSVGSDSTEREIEVFCDSMWSLLQAQAADFFAARSREVRHKRHNLDTENSDLDLWEARYTAKLAVFAELKSDFDGALRLYESSYDCALTFLNSSEVDTVGWTHARTVMDMIALKLCRLCLYKNRYDACWRKFQVHLQSTVALLKSTNRSSDPGWLASQYMWLADLLVLSKQTHGDPQWALDINSDADDTKFGSFLPRAGFLYLKAAKLGEPGGYEKAVADFSAFPRSKALALVDWAHNLKGEEAVDKYREALECVDPKWAALRRVISSKILELSKDDDLTAKFELFMLGDSKEIPKSDSDKTLLPRSPLFQVDGAFLSESAFLERPLQCQVTLTPNFKGTLTLDTIKIHLTSASVTLTHDPAAEPTRFCDASGPTSLQFESEPRTFQFSVRPKEIGELEFVEAIIAGKAPQLTQKLQVQTVNKIVDESGHSRHMTIIPVRFLDVKTRPARLTINADGIPAVVATDEELRLPFSITNGEREVSKVSVRVSSLLLNVNTSMNERTEVWSAEESIPPGETNSFVIDNFKAPKKSFKLEIVTDYTTETDVSPARQSLAVEIDVAKPFRSSFDLEPALHKEAWPNTFVPSDHCQPYPLIRRRWSLSANILTLADTPVIIHSREFSFSSQQASIVALQTKGAVNKAFQYNERYTMVSHFEVVRKDRDSRVFDAEANLKIEWSRAETPDVRNIFEASPVRLTLPNQEPRVLATAECDWSCNLVTIEYYIENSTSHILTFAVSMGTSPFFLIQGPKAFNMRLLPFSRRKVVYKTYPLDPGSINEPLPELRVFDTVYKQTLRVLSGNRDHLRVKNGSLILVTE